MRDACIIKKIEGIAQSLLAVVQHMVVRQADIPDTSGLQDVDGAGRRAKVEDLRRPRPRIATVADRAFEICQNRIRPGQDGQYVAPETLRIPVSDLPTHQAAEHHVADYGKLGASLVFATGDGAHPVTASSRIPGEKTLWSRSALAALRLTRIKGPAHDSRNNRRPALTAGENGRRR